MEHSPEVISVEKQRIIQINKIRKDLKGLAKDVRAALKEATAYRDVLVQTIGIEEGKKRNVHDAVK